MMPQGDQLGQKTIWALLKAMFDPERATGQLVGFELVALSQNITSAASPIPWRLWFSNMGQWTNALIGSGISKVSVAHQLSESQFEFTIERLDGNLQRVVLQRRMSRSRCSYDYYFDPDLRLR